MRKYLKNLMLSDVEESRNLTLNETDPSGNTGFAACNYWTQTSWQVTQWLGIAVKPR